MHYKRKRARVAARKWRFSRWEAKRLGDEHRWLSSWPRWWDIVYHRRPHRRKAARLIGAVLRGVRDPDNTAWPVSKKPHQYYW